MAKPSQTVQIPLASGLNQRMDTRAKAPPALDICKDVQFDRTGGLRTRYPFTAGVTSVVGGADLLDNGAIRHLDVVNGELVAQTASGLYSWCPEVNQWVFRDTHIAVSVTETDVFPLNGDQSGADRAELNGVIVTTWAVTSLAGGAGQSVFVAARDKETGATLLAPTTVASLSGALNGLQIVALQTKILLFTVSTSLKAIAIDPANLATSVAAAWTTISTGASSSAGTDAIQIPGTDSALVVLNGSGITGGTGSYTICKVTAALAVTSATKTPTNIRSGDVMSVAIDPTVTTVVVAYSAATGSNPPHINADVITLSSLASTHSNVDLGAVAGNNAIGGGGPAPAYYPIRVAAAFRTDNSGKCFVFWASGETNSQITFGHPIYFTSEINWIQATGTVGTKASFVGDMSLASRAFSYGGFAYVWGVFAGQTPVTAVGGGFTSLQNTNFLYRDDGVLIAKCLTDRSAGFDFFTAGPLPGVVLTGGSTYTWCGTSRRIVPIGFGNVYSGREPTDISFTFDDNQARRSAQVGRTMYLTGGQILQYDGTALSEVGFHVYPWMFQSVGTGSGSLSAGVYASKATTKCVNGVGEIDRSTTATIAAPTVTVNQLLATTVTPLYITRRATPITTEVWRTVVNPVAASPFFLATSQDPTSLTNPNRYLPNDSTAITLPVFNDALSDANISVNQTNPENGAVLASIAPPPATIVLANDTRLFLAGIAGQPDTVWYSKTRDDGYVASFNDGLTISVPRTGGSITGLAFVNQTLVVFRETAAYLYSGEGFDNLGGGSNYALSRVLSQDIGAQNQESIVVLDTGILFKSDKGWHQLDLGWNLQYVGAKVYNYDSETVVAAHALTKQQQVRILTANRLLVFDWNVGEWGEWTITGGVSACVWNGQYVYTDGSFVYFQNSTYSGVTYGMDIETAWIKMNDLQGDGRVRRILGIGEYQSEHSLRIRVARDYVYDGSGNVVYMDDVYWTVTPTTVGSVEQFSHGPTHQQCEAIKIRLTAVDATVNTNPPTGEALRLTGLALKLAVSPTPYPRLPAAQKA